MNIFIKKEVGKMVFMSFRFICILFKMFFVVNKDVFINWFFFEIDMLYRLKYDRYLNVLRFVFWNN